MSKENLNAGPCIRTYSGKYLNVFDPNPDDIVIEDIAHALALECRFGNHLPVHYSVAHHCIEVSEIVPDNLKLEALLHDASEAYLGDMPKPIKDCMREYKMVEDGLMRCIAAKFGFNYPLSQEVKKADTFVLEGEWIAFIVNEMVHPKDNPFLMATQTDIRVEFLRLFRYYNKLKRKEVDNG